MSKWYFVWLTLVVSAESVPAKPAVGKQPLSMSEFLDASPSKDWRVVPPSNTLYISLEQGVVIIELAPEFAPKHVKNIQTLAKEKFFDGLKIVRVQDNYVTQWGDPNGDDPSQAKSLGTALAKLPAEFERSGVPKTFIALPDGDVYAPKVGFVDGFPVAVDNTGQRVWLTHCYGMVGAGRGDGADSSSGSELFAVIGHGPRHLDHNITLVGRVLRGMEFLSALPRGKAPLGFYQDDQMKPAIKQIRLGSDLADNDRLTLEVLRTDSTTFKDLVELRRNRRDAWFVAQAGKIDLCNVPIPVREAKKPSKSR